MPRRSEHADEPVVQLKVTMTKAEPPVWRRILTHDMSLAEFHYLLQDAMGWTNSHLHQFLVGETCFGDPEFDETGRMQDEAMVTLADVLTKPGGRIVYVYDFGDNWLHEVLFEKIASPSARTEVPCCLDGGRACPPEDCGGGTGYADLLKALADPNHEDHQEMKDWLGREFDPEKFDLADANLAIKEHRTLKRTQAAEKEFIEGLGL